MLPYSLDTNDSSFTRPIGFSTADEAVQYWCDTFERLHREGRNRPKMMTIGLHARIIGRPGRIAALERFLDYLDRRDGVWVCQRLDIARHWMERHPAPNPV